ncbi:MAG TPA: HoxN/HupN/NixA family nickel/cobalt transporter [Thermoplasmata archaeon]|nr:HoxN/HupN/NixA family nickel/cobalt transporter [Thermoplasmata archaeon]
MSPAPDGDPLVLTRAERGTVAALYAAILAATLVGFVALYFIARTYNQAATGTHAAITFFGLGLIAYTLGLRHGVDADHIAAIDNTTRKLLQENRRPLTVGTWFSLGHSTVVVALVVALIVATRLVAGELGALRAFGAVIGTLVSGAFLWLIGLINVVIALEVYRIYRGLRRGEYNAAALDAQLGQRGFLNRYFGRFFRLVKTPRQIYPIGVLFGLGFDTATEIILIGTTVGLTFALNIPLVVILVLPLLFTAGMVLVDTTDGIMMRYAYGWAFLRPIRKVYYNLTITVVSVLVAFAIGTVELLQALVNELGLHGGTWSALNALDFETLGFVILGIFLGTWALALAYYRYKRLDDFRFGPGPEPGAGG